jgi:hypothetical protein
MAQFFFFSIIYPGIYKYMKCTYCIMCSTDADDTIYVMNNDYALRMQSILNSCSVRGDT